MFAQFLSDKSFTLSRIFRSIKFILIFLRKYKILKFTLIFLMFVTVTTNVLKYKEKNTQNAKTLENEKKEENSTKHR